MRLVTGKEMQEIDRYAIEEVGIPAEVLMENAGRGVAQYILERFSYAELRRGVLVFCGPGNNGGDGFVAARYLYSNGIPTTVVLLADETRYRGESLTNLKIVKYMEIPLRKVYEEKDLDDLREIVRASGIIVDALFGTGLSRELKGIFARAVELINSSGIPVVSVDIPSGLCAETGRPLGVAVRATCTVTMGLPKVGHVLYPGRILTGELKVIDIGFPKKVFEEKGPKREYLDETWASRRLRSREPDTHKGTYGHLLVVAGSRGKTGAAVLAAEGALRAGAGLVTFVSAASLQPLFASYIPEALTYGSDAETEAQELSPEAVSELVQLASRAKAAVVGPGAGLSERAKEFLRKASVELPVPTVVDADALTAISQDPSILKSAPSERILTPHPGEMSRLLHLPKEEVVKKRLEVARRASELTGAVVVLKGAATVVVSPDGREAVNSTGNPGMAQGGMGDVLSGIIGALLAQGYPAFEAACLGVYLHGASADELAKRVGPYGYTAREVAQNLPRTIRRLGLLCERS